MTDTLSETKQTADFDDYKHGFHVAENYVFKGAKSKVGLTREMVIEISNFKREPEWMLERRLKAFEIFQSKPMPTWGDT